MPAGAAEMKSEKGSSSAKHRQTLRAQCVDVLTYPNRAKFSFAAFWSLETGRVGEQLGSEQ